MRRKLIALAVFVSIAISPLAVFSQDMSQWIFPVFLKLNSSGPLSNGFLCTTTTGTSNHLATYRDRDLLIPNQNPIRLNLAGRPVSGSALVPIYMQPAVYRYTLHAAGTSKLCNGVAVGAVVAVQDSIYGASPIGTGGALRIASTNTQYGQFTATGTAGTINLKLTGSTTQGIISQTADRLYLSSSGGSHTLGMTKSGYVEINASNGIPIDPPAPGTFLMWTTAGGLYVMGSSGKVTLIAIP